MSTQEICDLLKQILDVQQSQCDHLYQMADQLDDIHSIITNENEEKRKRERERELEREERERERDDREYHERYGYY